MDSSDAVVIGATKALAGLASVITVAIAGLMNLWQEAVLIAVGVLLAVAVVALLPLLRKRGLLASAQTGRLDALDSDLMADEFPLPVVHSPPGEPVVGATFDAVNRAAVEYWGHHAERLTSVPYEDFVVTDVEATRSAAASTDYTGHVNAYGSGEGRKDIPVGSPLYQRWHRVGEYAIAVPIDDLAQARADLEAERRRTQRLRGLVETARTQASQALEVSSAVKLLDALPPLRDESFNRREG